MALPLCLNLSVKNNATDNVEPPIGKFSNDNMMKGYAKLAISRSKASETGVHEDAVYPWNDMDLTKNATCGLDKCFFRSISNNTLGYLVSGAHQYGYMEEAFELAQNIHQDFGAKHFYLELERVHASRALQERLNGLVHQPNRNLEGWEQEDVFLTDDDLTCWCLALQKVRVAPEPSLFVALAGQNRQVTLKHIDSFRDLIPDKEAFHRQFSEEMERIGKVLDEYPRLRYDFQGMVDVDGNFYFVDMDGQHYQREPHPEKKLNRVRQNQRGKLEETLRMLTG
jgi:hypothetical protein